MSQRNGESLAPFARKPRFSRLDGFDGLTGSRAPSSLPASLAPSSEREADDSTPGSLADRLRFLAAFVRRPATVGSLTPSSVALGRAMTQGCQFDQAQLVVELGPGTGAFTRFIVQKTGHRTRVMALELDEHCVAMLRRRFPRVQVFHDSAENLLKYLPGRGRGKADYIVSGLPWVNMTTRTREKILDVLLRSLRPGGTFVAFAYAHAAWLPAARHFRQRLKADFEEVTVSPIVWRNLPPAVVYRCR